MTTKSELLEFRAKLVKARRFSAQFDYRKYYGAWTVGGLPMTGDHTDQYFEIKDWYFANGRKNSERKAMWTNSIAAIDKQIAELHQ